MNSPSRVARLVTGRKTMISAVALAVSARTLQETVSDTGTLTPTVDDEVSFAASGTVTAVKVTEGQTVKKGDALAMVTTTQADADHASAKATLASAQAELSTAKSSSTGFDTDVATIESDEAVVTSAQASVTSAQTEVDGTALKAPAAGIVAAVNVAVGDEVSGTSSSSGSSGSSGSGSSATGGTWYSRAREGVALRAGVVLDQALGGGTGKGAGASPAAEMAQEWPALSGTGGPEKA